MELFGENLVRGRGLLCRSVMKAQSQSQIFSHVYAAVVAVINTKMPEIGELLLLRLMNQFFVSTMPPEYREPLVGTLLAIVAPSYGAPSAPPRKAYLP